MEWFISYGQIWLIVLPLVFLAAVVDAVAGGGGLIALPAYLLVLPPHIAAATNKFAASFGTLTSLIRFIHAKKVYWKSSLLAAAGALIGAPIGTQIQMHLSEQLLNQMLLIVLPIVAIFLLCRPDIGCQVQESLDCMTLKNRIQAVLIGLMIGAYDGLIGPGTGTFLILAFCTFLKFDMVFASGSAKVVNFTSNIAALVVYLIHGQVLFTVGIPALLCAIAGYQVGASLAIQGGRKVIRALVFVVFAMMLIKIAYTIR